jgi:hypothetical protein
MFTLDLHGVSRSEAARVIRARLKECYKYGLLTLRIVFGSPERYEGTILEALCEIVQLDPNVLTAELPDWVFDPEMTRDPRLTFLAVPIRLNPKPEPLDENVIFQKFKADKEESRAQRLLCGIPYEPLRRSYSWKYAARAIGGDCREDALASICNQLGIVTPSGRYHSPQSNALC